MGLTGTSYGQPVCVRADCYVCDILKAGHERHGWADIGRLHAASPVVMTGPLGGPWSAEVRLGGRPMRLTVAIDPSVAICGATDGPVICRCPPGHDGPHIAFENTQAAARVGLHLARLESIR